MQRRVDLAALALTAVLFLSGCTSAIPVSAVSGSPSSTAAAVDPDQFTPLVPSVMSTPRWFTGADDLVHLVYEVQLINGFALPLDLQMVTVLELGTDRVVATLAGADLVAAMTHLGAFAGETSIVAASSVSVLWMDVTFEDADNLPGSISHAFSVLIPGGLPLPNPLVYTGATAKVDLSPPVVLSPPLAGPGWIAVGSCCDGPHRRALQPVNDSLRLGQRFAIDWNGSNADGYMAVGDQSLVKSWVFYNAPVLAVANATVVVATDSLQNQIPGAPQPVGIEDADGNHIILDIGDGRYVFYAHLAPGSVAVDVGDRVCVGEQIARLGNTGNTTGPHLHMHVSNAISAFDADGLPFVFDSFQFDGKIPPLDDAITLVEAGRPLPVDPAGADARTAELPLGRDVVTFPEAASCSP